MHRSPVKIKMPQAPINNRNSRSQGPRSIRFRQGIRQKALNSIKHAYNTIKNMTNEQYNKVFNNLKTFKKQKNYGLVSINNTPYLIAAHSNKLIRGQKW